MKHKFKWLYRIGNGIKIACWLILLPYLHFYILTQTENDFKDYLKNGSIIKDSFLRYRSSLWVMLSIALLLGTIWWLIACLSFNIRESFENHTLRYAITFIGVFFLLACIVFFIIPGIQRENRSFQPLVYVFSYPSVFSFLIFALPPGNVNKVIFPNIAGRLFLILLFLALTAFLIMIKGV